MSTNDYIERFKTPAADGEDYLEEVIVNSEDLTITIVSNTGETKTFNVDDQETLNRIGMEMRLALYEADFDTKTTTETVWQ